MSAFRIVEVGDKEYEFPSEMSNDEIKAVLDKKFGSTATAPPPAPEATPEVVSTTPPTETGEPSPPPVSIAEATETEQLMSDEGSRKNKQGEDITYADSKGNLTGGTGHLLTEEEKKLYPEGVVIPKEVTDAWFKKDVAEAQLDVQTLLPNTPEEVKDIFTNMAFQLGREGLRGFKDTLSLVKKGRYVEASKEMLKSDWARKDSPERAKRLSKRLVAFAKNNPEEGVEAQFESLAKIEKQQEMLKIFSSNPDLTFNEMKEGGVFDETIEKEIF